MRQRLRFHLTYANVMVTILAFIVLSGGTAVALSGSNTVFSDDIANDTFNSPTQGQGGLVAADLRPNSVGTSEAANNSLTGTDVNEGTLNLAAGAYREVGAAGQPAFNATGTCAWNNFQSFDHSTAAFLRDRFGFVHLKGLVDADDVSAGCDFNLGGAEVSDRRIFNLPAGYRPAKRSVFATIAGAAAGRVTVDGPEAGLGAGAVSVDSPTSEANAEAFLSLDGISFRCAPSGSNGCP